MKEILGQYNCKITPTGMNASEISTFSTNITIWAISDEGEVESQILEVPFVPGVYANPEVFIGEFGTYGELEVCGLDYVLEQITVTFNFYRLFFDTFFQGRTNG